MSPSVAVIGRGHVARASGGGARDATEPVALSIGILEIEESYFLCLHLVKMIEQSNLFI